MFILVKNVKVLQTFVPYVKETEYLMLSQEHVVAQPINTKPMKKIVQLVMYNVEIV